MAGAGARIFVNSQEPKDSSSIDEKRWENPLRQVLSARPQMARFAPRLLPSSTTRSGRLLITEWKKHAFAPPSSKLKDEPVLPPPTSTFITRTKNRNPTLLEPLLFRRKTRPLLYRTGLHQFLLISGDTSDGLPRQAEHSGAGRATVELQRRFRLKDLPWLRNVRRTSEGFASRATTARERALSALLSVSSLPRD